MSRRTPEDDERPQTTRWIVGVLAHTPRVIGWLVLLACVVWPTAALIGRCVTQGEAPSNGWSFSPNQVDLLLRSVSLSLLATAACMLFALPGAYVVGRLGRLSRRPFVTAMIVAPLLCSPMVYAFGWERVELAVYPPAARAPAAPAVLNDSTPAPPRTPADRFGEARCVLVWALWAWPIPALILGGAWARIGRSSYEAAVLVASPASALLRAVAPLLSRHIALSALILFVLFMGDYAVPHACLLQVYATELLGWASSSNLVIDTLWPALPPGVVIGVALLLMVWLWRSSPDTTDVTVARHVAVDRSPFLVVLALACFGVAVVLPVATLVVSLDGPSVFIKAIRTYGDDIAASFAVAAFAGVLAVMCGVALAAHNRLRQVGVVWSVIFGTLPGALIGISLIAAFNHSATGFVYDNWPIVVIAYVSRFAWIALLAVVLTTQASGAALAAQARTDGASTAAILGHVHLPLNLPVIAGAIAIVASRSLSELPASSLVRVPGFNPIAHVMIEKFHRFEDGMLISLSLVLAIAGLVATFALLFAIRRRDEE